MRTMPQPPHNPHQAKRRTLCLIALLLVWLTLAWPVQAQTPTPPSRDALIHAIQQRAQSDVAMNKALESVSGLESLFGEEAAVVGMPLRDVVETYETAYQAAKSAQSPWESLRPNIGWLVAGILAILLILYEVIKDYLTRFFNWLAEAIYRQVARYKLFWGVALRRYRKALERNHRELRVPFRPGRPLQMQTVYVPLRVAESGSREMVNAYQAVQQHKSLVVVGAPGSGKTMLLNHLTLTYARQGLNDFSDPPIPVLLQLHRLNDSDDHLTEHLAKVLERNDFPGGKGFVTASLERGQLLLLFDGLDEVNSLVRGKVVGRIKDLLQRYPKNRAIVTCRTQVYKDEFSDRAEQKLEIVEFSDQQIQRFLSAWEPDMPEGKSIEHLLRTLYERPQIMALARNPLLLTMIAYLYTDTAFVLPHSRAEFYDDSTKLLLERWKRERNHYKVAQKRLVLQHLALFNQERARRAGGDRRSIDIRDVLAQICAVLPTLTLKEEDAQPMLDEIVERSGLMLPVDGGARYQFSHLTLQEFFAAQALAAEPDKLLEHFSADRDAWREVLRLWCGLEHDSTYLIRQVYQVEPVMAFACLGDAQQVETDYVAELVDVFKGRLAEAFGNENLARAFAMVAADPRRRGKTLFEFLKSSLNVPILRPAASAVLVLTNLPKAADALAECAVHDPGARPYLVWMGDLSVPALATYARQHQTWAMDALHEVGTPQAALALLPLLWDDDARLPYHAAWRLAALLPRPNIEFTLRSVDLTPEQRKAEQIDWIWSPFDEPPDSALPVIAGRIAHLLHTAPDKTIPSDWPPGYDPRLVIPLCAVAAQGGQLEEIEADERKELIEEMDQVFHPLSTENLGNLDQAHDFFVLDHTDQISTHPVWRYLFKSLPSVLRSNLLCCLIQNEPTPNADDWRNVLRPSSYVFETSWQARAVKLLLALLGLLNLWGLVDSIRQRPQLLSRENGLAILGGMVIVVLLWALGRSKLKLDNLGSRLAWLALGVGPAIGVIVWTISGDWLLSIVAGIVSSVVVVALIFIVVDANNVSTFFFAVLLGVVLLVRLVFVDDADAVGNVLVSLGNVLKFFGLVNGILIYLPMQLLYGSLGVPSVALFWIVYLAGFSFLVWHSKRQRRRAQNPLHGLLSKLDFTTAPPSPLPPLTRWLRRYRRTRRRR